MATVLQHRLLADPVRARLLEILAAAERPLDVRALAVAVGRHPNSVREQLERLADAGFVVRVTTGAGDPPTAGPADASVAEPHPVRPRGRPPHRYRLAAGARVHTGGSGPLSASDPAASAAPALADTGSTPSEAAYRDLARVLADALRRLGGPPAAELAGRAWGAALAGRRRRRTDARRALRRLLDLLDAAGFAPEPTTRLDAPIRLRRCPFGALARERQEVVCGVHLGMLRGALEAMAAPVEATALEPFVRPDLCLVRLAPAGRAGAPTDASCA